jgi:hypothetical protein
MKIARNSGSKVSLTFLLLRIQKPSAQGYNWATLFLGDMNTET